MSDLITTPGSFAVGCNYWASHAGTKMWSDWRADVVQADFKQLSENGLQVLRVFPLWPDFQPITQYYTGAGAAKEIRMGETPLGDDDLGRAGVSAVMMERFKELARLAEHHHLKLVVGLLTGWMSGRLFTPPALEGRNVITDPVALMWETRFVRAFVRHLKGSPAILAWDLGNECNVMGAVSDHAAAYAWTAAITGAIRREDPTRPIVSGMHSLDEPSARGPWRIDDQAELLDILTTHPYPYWTPYCAQEPVNTVRPLLHSTAQTRWYGDVGGKTAFCEETGTLGPMISNEALSADFLRSALLSLWAHDCRALLWWCAYDQAHLTHPPYDWAAFERELGLFRVTPDGANPPKPVVAVMKAFRGFVDHAPFKNLPPRIIDAVCVLTEDQEQWAAAFSSFILAKQAGLDIEFQYTNRPLKKARIYIVPSASGGGSMPHSFWEALMAETRAGASLYVSHDDCFLSPFEEVFGVEVVSRGARAADASVRFTGGDDSPLLKVPSKAWLKLAPTRAEVLAEEPDGSPAFTRAKYGKGWAYFLTLPVETGLVNQPGAFDRPDERPYWQFYRMVAQSEPGERAVTKNHPLLGLTEHPLNKGRRVVVAINYSPEPVQAEFALRRGWQMEGALWGAPLAAGGPACQGEIPANDGVVFMIREGA